MKKIIVLTCIVFTTFNSKAQVVSTFAGGFSFADGNGISAHFNSPNGLCSDSSGNVYVADNQNNRIRKITPSGIVSTLAGSGLAGSDDGIGTTAKFNGPNGLCADITGNIYVVEAYNHKIRKITPTGEVTTFAGSGIGGYVDGLGTASKFYFPFGICSDSSGNIYVADSGNNRIRKITPSGVVSTLAGSGPSGPGGYADGIGSSARFNNPCGVCSDSSGNIYVADTQNNRIRKITPSGVVTTFAGSGGGYLDGTGNAAQFGNPRGLCSDSSGNIYVADIQNYRIRKITPSGVVSTIAGSTPNSSFEGYIDGTGIVSQFRTTSGVCSDSLGNIYVADSENQRIRKINSTGVVSTFAGTTISEGIGSSARFNNPYGVCSDSSGNIYVADTHNNRIRKITPSGVVSTFAGSGSGVPGFVDGIATFAQFNSPCGLCSDSFGNIYVADTGNHRIRKITPSGVVSTFAGSGAWGYSDGDSTTSQFYYPFGVCSDFLGNIYVADTGNQRIRKITPSGVVSTFAGSGILGYADGNGISANFFSPKGICSDSSGNIYLAEFFNKRIRKITSLGVVSTLAGSGVQGFADGAGSNAQFTEPHGIAVDPSGVIYVVDVDRIRKITPSGVVSTLAGSGIGSYVDGYGTAAQFFSPFGICSNSSGEIFVADSGNNRIRKILICDVTASISYNGNSTFCNNSSPQQVLLTGTGSYIGGIYNSTTGLSIDVSTGTINPSDSFPGNYTIIYTTPSNGGCYAADSTQITILATPDAIITADDIFATSTTISNGNAVQLQLYGDFNSQLQWTPATAISSTSISNPLVYPSATTTYTASFMNSNGCPKTTSFTVNVTPQPNIGTLSLSSSNATIGLFDTITVNVQLNNATDVYSLYMKLKGNDAVSQYLDYTGYTAGTLLGGNIISTPPTVSNGVYDFGMTKVGAVPGYAGSGLFYTFIFVQKNNIIIPTGTTFCFYLDDVSAYNASGIPCGLTNQGQYCYNFTDQVAVWPGDLNKSNTVTTADLLPIGYFYNSTGPTRPNANIQWMAQPATLWGYDHSSNYGDAYKVFADSNGDGVINNADQAAIGHNMNQIHSKMGTPTSSSVPLHFSAQQLASVLGTLTVTPNNTIINGAALPQSVTFNVNVNNTGGLNSLYGISANLLFDDAIFDFSTATIDYTGSIFGIIDTDCLEKRFISSNMISVGLTRYANVPINGQGLLFKVTIQTKSELPNLALTPITAYVDAANNQAGNTLVIQDAPTTNLTIINNLGIDNINQDEFLLYPNPASDKIYIVMGSNATQTNDLKLKVFNILGQSIEEQPIQNTTTELSTKNWGASGVYFVQITNQNNTMSITKKVIVNRK